MIDLIREPWPWYVAGPILGLIVPALLLIGNKAFGMSSTLRHLCAASLPGRAEFFRYDWKRSGAWNLAMAAGVLVGGWVAATWLGGGGPVAISGATVADLTALGVRDFGGLVPADVFSLPALLTPAGAVCIVLGGVLVGFGAAYAGGCTSGHTLSGLADLQLPSLLASAAFFAGGALATHFVLPLLFQGGAP
ncbi:MAG: YeeE/YedE family protein [Longimicrobiales bacterium]